ncbi:hypothetical protein FKM82_017081 [Ascaphus truei]
MRISSGELHQTTRHPPHLPESKITAMAVPSAVPSPVPLPVLPSDPKLNGHHPTPTPTPTPTSTPRMSVCSRASMVTTMDSTPSGLHSVMKWKTVLAIFVVVVVYLVSGGLVFRALEQPFESSQKSTIAQEKADFLRDHPCVTQQELDALIQFGLFLPGYGNIAPSTEGGKIFCILYAIFGIPLFGFLLAGIGDQLGTIFGKSIAKVEKVFRKKQVSQTKIRVISTILFIVAGCLVFVTIPAVIFIQIEGWTELESIYFVVVTLTTVGFGDFVGEIKAHAAEWKANVTAEFRETRRRLSVEIHDKLQRAATIRSMERRRLGLDQRAHSLDMLSPEKRSVFAELETGHFKAASQDSINNRPNNLRLKGAEQFNLHGQGLSEDNIINKFGSNCSKLTKRKNKDLKKNLPEDVRKIYENFRKYAVDEVKREDEAESISNSDMATLSDFIQHSVMENGSVSSETKEEEQENKALLEERK